MTKEKKNTVIKSILYPVISALLITLIYYGIENYKNNAVSQAKKENLDSLQNANIRTISYKTNQVDSMFAEKNKNTNSRINKLEDKIIPFLEKIEKRMVNFEVLQTIQLKNDAKSMKEIEELKKLNLITTE